MRAFLVGLLFLFVAAILAGAGVMLFPILLVTGLLLRFILMLAFAILCIWLLGKLILFLWGKLK